MISLTRLLCDKIEPHDNLRYGDPHGKITPSAENRPIVVWNSVKACNLRCIHCYAQSDEKEAPNLLDTNEAKRMIDDIAAYGCPVLLFSGGEPMLRKDLIELAVYAKDKGLRTVISTNGTLITEDKAKALKDAGISYAGISLDGLEQIHDKFRGTPGCFQKTLQGIRNCLAVGLRTGLRLTITSGNYQDVPGVFDLAVKEGIPRQCYYHLVYTGRGSALIKEDLDTQTAREVMDTLIDKVVKGCENGYDGEVLTVDNHADGPYLYFWAKKNRPERAAEILRLLKVNAARSTGMGISCIDWEGNVYPDQFWREKLLGNIRERPFSKIWTDPGNEFLREIREREKHVTGRCASCGYLDTCRGNFRARAEAATGDIWAPDPACYLLDEEIAP